MSNVDLLSKVPLFSSIPLRLCDVWNTYSEYKCTSYNASVICIKTSLKFTKLITCGE